MFEYEFLVTETRTVKRKGTIKVRADNLIEAQQKASSGLLPKSWRKISDITHVEAQVIDNPF